MRVALICLATLGLLASGCASHQRRAPICELGCQKTQLAPVIVQPCEPCANPFWQQVFAPPSDEVRAARLRLAAAIVVVAGEIVFEIIRNN